MNRLYTLRRHWPVAVAALIFLLGSFRRVAASSMDSQTDMTSSSISSPVFMLSVYTFILIVAALVLTNMHRRTLKTKTPLKAKPKSKAKK